MVLLAKALSGGFAPVGAVLTRRWVFDKVFDRMDSPTLTARLCSPFTDLRCAQWDEQRRFMPDAEVIGRLL